MNKEKWPTWLAVFTANYETLSVDNLHLLKEIYHQDVIFQDPAHKLTGFSELENYFQSLYTNLKSCTFSIDKVIVQDDRAGIYWRMAFVHPRLNGGEIVSVEGHSLLRGEDNKVVEHRDYVDLGAMLYEHIPLLGKGVRFIKHRLGK